TIVGNPCEGKSTGISTRSFASFTLVGAQTGGLPAQPVNKISIEHRTTQQQ
ncbi:MAG: hypothetical protein H7Z14_09685, partial [Anaerolineae bacterium]|nr:hypothetical protein [Phycisphaerae bacterium]